MDQAVILYSAPSFNIPPSEKNKNRLYIELQEGCPYGKCNYCKTYAGIPFRNKDIEEVKNNINITLDVLANRFEKNYNKQSFCELDGISRIYLGGADILEYPLQNLKEIIEYTKHNLEEVSKGNVKSKYITKIAGYATTRSLNKISGEELKELNKLGLNIIYWGLESGSDSVLALANKNFTQKEALNIAEKSNDTKIMFSVNIIPGLGGIKYYEEHMKETIKVLAAINPRWVTFLTLDYENTLYDKVISEDQSNKHLTRYEIKKQMVEITLGLERELGGGIIKRNICKVASHPYKITPISDNPIEFEYIVGNEFKYILVNNKLTQLLELAEDFKVADPIIRKLKIRGKIAENLHGLIFALGSSVVIGGITYLTYLFFSK